MKIFTLLACSDNYEIREKISRKDYLSKEAIDILLNDKSDDVIEKITIEVGRKPQNLKRTAPKTDHPLKALAVAESTWLVTYSTASISLTALTASGHR